MGRNMYTNTVVLEDIENIINNFSYKDFSNKSILITGGTGLLSSYLVLFFNHLNKVKNAGIDLHVNVRSASRFFKRTGLDATDVNLIEKNVEDLVCDDINTSKLDYIFHLASSSSPHIIRTSPTSIINANILGTFSVIEIAKKFSSKVIFSSTREVYGQVDDSIKSIKETDIGSLDSLELRSCYPESKRMAENIIVSSAYEFGLDYAICRIAHVYGPGMAISNDGRIMSDLIGNVVNHEDITLLSDGSALRAFCYITDATLALLKIATSDKYNVYNIANETEEISILDLSKKLIEIFDDRNLKVTYKKPSDTLGYVKFSRVTLDTSRLESIGWEPSVSLDIGLEKTVKSFSEGDVLGENHG